MGFLDNAYIWMQCHTVAAVTNIVSEVGDAMKEGETSSEMANINNKVDTFFGGGISIGTRVGVYLAVIAIVAFGIGLLFANNQTKQDKKGEVLPKAIGIVCIIAPVSLLTIFELVVNGVFAE